MMMRNLAAAVVSATLITGCKDATGPRPFSGTYVLAEVDGTGAPLVTSDHTFSNGERLVHSIVYDTIQFTSATRARRSESLQAVRYDVTGTPQHVNAVSATYQGDVQHTGNGVTITWQALGGTIAPQQLDYVNGTLEWATMIGLICSDNCPAPRSAVFTYVRP